MSRYGKPAKTGPERKPKFAAPQHPPCWACQEEGRLDLQGRSRLRSVKPLSRPSGRVPWAGSLSWGCEVCDGLGYIRDRVIFDPYDIEKENEMLQAERLEAVIREEGERTRAVIRDEGEKTRSEQFRTAYGLAYGESPADAAERLLEDASST